MKISHLLCCYLLLTACNGSSSSESSGDSTDTNARAVDSLKMSADSTKMSADSVKSMYSGDADSSVKVDGVKKPKPKIKYK